MSRKCRKEDKLKKIENKVKKLEENAKKIKANLTQKVKIELCIDEDLSGNDALKILLDLAKTDPKRVMRIFEETAEATLQI